MAKKATVHVDDHMDAILDKVNAALLKAGLSGEWCVDRVRLRPTKALAAGCRTVRRVVWYTNPRTGRRYREVREEVICD